MTCLHEPYALSSPRRSYAIAVQCLVLQTRCLVAPRILTCYNLSWVVAMTGKGTLSIHEILERGNLDTGLSSRFQRREIFACKPDCIPVESSACLHRVTFRANVLPRILHYVAQLPTRNECFWSALESLVSGDICPTMEVWLMLTLCGDLFSRLDSN